MQKGNNSFQIYILNIINQINQHKQAEKWPAPTLGTERQEVWSHILPEGNTR